MSKGDRGKRRKRATGKTPGKTAVKPLKIPQAHGGAIYAGGVVGNKGGLGVPPSVVRQAFRGSLAERRPVLETIADGEVVQKMRVPLLAVLPHMKCNLCGAGDLVPNDPETAGDVVIEVMASASPRDRTMALKVIADVGMQTSRLDQEDVRARLMRTIELLYSELGPAGAGPLVAKMQPIWTAP